MMSIALLGCFLDSLARASLRVRWPRWPHRLGPARSLAWRLAGVLAVALAGIALLGAASSARAEGASSARSEGGASPLDASLLESVRSLALDKAAQPGAPRVELVIGQLDPRLHLAPCQRVEPYLPPGTRLWGKSRIGLRCAEGRTPWNVYLPITVKIFGRALVVPAGAAAGGMLTMADLAEAEVDLAEEFTPAVVDPQQATGRVLAQNLKPGQTLRQGHLKARQWFAAGETVKVVAIGEGFTLESEAQALNNGIEGQPARVRTEGGKVLTGVAAGERRVEVAL